MPKPARDCVMSVHDLQTCKSLSIGTIMLLIAMCTWIPVHAGDAPANAARQEATPPLTQNQASTWYTTQKGDSLLSLARSRYKGSPLRLEVLRDAIVAANPELAKRKTTALKPGTQLILPEHSWIMLQTMTPFVSAKELAQWLPSSEVVDTTPKRDWVRFP